MYHHKIRDEKSAARVARGCYYCADKAKCKGNTERCPYRELDGFDTYDDFLESGAPDYVNEILHDLYGISRDSH